MARQAGLPTDTQDQPKLARRRRRRRVSRAASIGLLALATVAGVRLGFDAPTISPVSPSAIAARYGGLPPGSAPPPAGPPSMPLGEIAASAPPGVAAAPSAETIADLPAEASALTHSDAVQAPATTTTSPPIVSQDNATGHRSGQHDGGRHD